MTEHEQQKIIIAFCHQHEELRCIFAIPNGGIRDIGTSTKLKAEGVKKGVPDLFMPLAKKGYYGLFLELKTKTGSLSKEQKEWQQRLNENGYKAIVCYGYQEAIEEIKNYAL